MLSEQLWRVPGFVFVCFKVRRGVNFVVVSYCILVWVAFTCLLNILFESLQMLPLTLLDILNLFSVEAFLVCFMVLTVEPRQSHFLFVRTVVKCVWLFVFKNTILLKYLDCSVFVFTYHLWTWSNSHFADINFHSINQTLSDLSGVKSWIQLDVCRIYSEHQRLFERSLFLKPILLRKCHFIPFINNRRFLLFVFLRRHLLVMHQLSSRLDILGACLAAVMDWVVSRLHLYFQWVLRI